MRKKKSSKKQWAVSEKLEIVQARQNGLTLDEVKSLYGVSLSAISGWVEKYEKGGIAGLEAQPTGGAARRPSQRVEAANLQLQVDAHVPAGQIANPANLSVVPRAVKESASPTRRFFPRR